MVFLLLERKMRVSIQEEADSHGTRMLEMMDKGKGCSVTSRSTVKILPVWLDLAQSMTTYFVVRDNH